MSRDKLLKLRETKRRVLDHGFDDVYAEVIGDTVTMFTRSHSLAVSLPRWMEVDFGNGVTGLDMIVSEFGVYGVEVVGPRGVDLEILEYDLVVQEAMSNESVQTILKKFGGRVVGVRPIKRRKR